jgi:predicted XRE-type DNA-binding protein
MDERGRDDMRGSGNVFRDFGHPNPEILQLKAILAAKIIGVLDEQKITVRRAHELTGFAAADFSRVRQAKLQRFTLDRLIEMLNATSRYLARAAIDATFRPSPSMTLLVGIAARP